MRYREAVGGEIVFLGVDTVDESSAVACEIVGGTVEPSAAATGTSSANSAPKCTVPSGAM